MAVLCPFGPLRLLIESSRTQQKEVPALLYSVNAVWFMMASTDHLRLSSSMLGDETHRPNDKVVFRQSGSSFIPNNFRRSHDGFMRLPDDSHVTVSASSTTDRHPPDVTPAEPNDTSIKVEADEEDGKYIKHKFFFICYTYIFLNCKVERSGLKLGLGDFVFYSVLIARAGNRCFKRKVREIINNNNTM